MRIGEIRNILREVANENHSIEMKHEVIYGGQAHQINNFKSIIDALDIISGQEWSQADYAPVEDIKKKYKAANDPIILEAGEFNKLNSYINTVNAMVPLYYSIIDSLTDKQEEKTINIRLQDGLNSFESLNDANKRINNLLNLFNVDGQFEFRGFDRGTEWYILVAQGILSHSFLIGGLRVAQEYFKARKEYFKSEEAKISYKAALRKDEEETDSGFREYQEKRLSIMIDSEVEKMVKELGTNGQTNEELHSKIVLGTKKLIKELDRGTEVHLSLNPPSYTEEQNGELNIDYEKIRSLLPKKDTKPKQLGGGDIKKNDKK